jgi:hypothetical protein
MSAIVIRPFAYLKGWFLMLDRRDLLALKQRLEAEQRGVAYALRENDRKLRELGLL